MPKTIVRASSVKQRTSLSSVVTLDAVNTTFKMGGKDNLITAMDVTLSIDSAPHEEAEQLYKLIESIESINFYSSSIQKDELKQLISGIGSLLALSCLSGGQLVIQLATMEFLQNTINAMPLHPIDPGFPGFDAYQKELKSIHDALIFMNRQLFQNKIIISKTKLKFNIPSDVDNDYDFEEQLKRCAMPKTVEDFLVSIEDNQGCRAIWSSFFHDNNSKFLSRYFKELINSVNHPYYEGKFVESFVYKLERFANGLAQRSSAFPIQMMFDVIKGLKCRLPNSKADEDNTNQPVQSEYDKQLSQLKQKIDTLVVSDVSFNTNFAEFRQSLANSFQIHNSLRDETMLQLQRYFSSKVVGINEANKSAVQTYLERCAKRLTNDKLPSGLSALLPLLNTKYKTNCTLSRSRYKVDFLESWVQEITAHPEKTYSECYRLALAKATPAIQALVSERSQLGFFDTRKHQFKSFIRELLQAEPDYDQLYPTAPRAAR